MRKSPFGFATIVFFSLALTACTVSDDGGGGGNGNNGLASCSNGDQKRFVRDAMQDWYLWNDLLPNNISVSDYDSPEELVADLMNYSPDDGTGNPIDRFSFVGSAAADAAFFSLPVIGRISSFPPSDSCAP